MASGDTKASRCAMPPPQSSGPETGFGILDTQKSLRAPRAFVCVVLVFTALEIIIIPNALEAFLTFSPRHAHGRLHT